MNPAMNKSLLQTPKRQFPKADQNQLELLRSTLGKAREKLEIYRDHSDGEYKGGIQHTTLIRMIDEALALTASPR